MQAVLETPMKLNFSEWFTITRGRTNLSQAKVAEHLGIRTQSVGNWENGRSVPTLNPLKMHRLCTLLGVSLQEMAEAMDDDEIN